MRWASRSLLSIRPWLLHSNSHLRGGEVQHRSAESSIRGPARPALRVPETRSLARVTKRLRSSRCASAIQITAFLQPRSPTAASRQNPAQNRIPFARSGSGSSRIRFTADLASHSRAVCRNKDTTATEILFMLSHTAKQCFFNHLVFCTHL